jgi:hypothetical protein
VKCSWVKFEMERSEVSTSVVMWCEGLCNRTSIIIRRYIDHIWLFCLSHYFHILLFPSGIIVYTVVCFVSFCLILQIVYSECCVDILLLVLRILIVMYVPLWVLFICKCVL